VIKRLRVKFVCINMSIVAVMLIIIFGTVLHFTTLDLRQRSMAALEMANSDRKPRGIPGEMPNKAMRPFFTVEIDAAGNQTLCASAFFDLSDKEMLQTLIEAAQSAPVQTGILRKYQLRFSRHRTPIGVRLVFVDISDEIETIEGLLKTCVGIGLLSFAVFLGLSILLSYWAIRPVEKAWQQQRQFVADASHELKTPLTVIMSNAELLQEPQYTEVEKLQFSGSILTMSRQMRGLVEGLLELARVDNGSESMAMDNLNLSEIVSECVMLFEPVYFEKGKKLESQVEEEIWIRGSGSHLCQVMEILLDNGCKYASDGGTVEVRLSRQGSQCLLSVASPGEAISREDLKNIFKRFYRIDKVRSMNESYGLGLSIAWSVITGLGGKIWAESENGMNTFYIALNLTAGNSMNKT